MNESTTLIASLGGQPQIITFTLDLLLALGERIDQVVVVYLGGSPRYARAYRRLAGEFAGDKYAGRPCHLRGLAVRAGNTPLAEARTPLEVEAVRAAFYGLLAELKGQGQRIHLSLSGGRRIMALTGLAAAMQHLTPADRIWHLYTPPELTQAALEGQILHAAGKPESEAPSLIAVPFVPWAAYFPGLRPLLDQPAQAGPALAFGWQDPADRERCRQVWQALTPRQQDVLRRLAAGDSREQAALRLGIRITTLDTHRKAILARCAQAWEAEPGRRIDLQFVRQQFAPFLAALQQV